MKHMLLLGIIFYSFACDNKHCPDNSHDNIYIVNNSEQQINWIKDDNPNDSIWSNNGSSFPASTQGLVMPFSNLQIAAGLSKCWEYFYQNNYYEYYFIFDHDSVEILGWQAINKTNRGMLKRVKVDLDYLQSNNFTITYP